MYFAFKSVNSQYAEFKSHNVIRIGGMSSSQRTGGVESARKALQMLLAFNESRPRASVEELADEVGLPRSSAYRYVSLLREVGLLEEDRRGIYRVSARVHSVARAADAAGTLIMTTRPFLSRLADETGETSVLVRLLGDAAVAVDQIESRHPIRLAFSPGRTMPLVDGAPAKLLLASLPASTRAAYLDKMERADPRLRARRAAREEELARIRRQGWAESTEEVDPGCWGTAAPIIQRGRVIAALSVAGPLSRIDAEARQHVLDRTIAAAKDVSDRLAGLA